MTTSLQVYKNRTLSSILFTALLAVCALLSCSFPYELIGIKLSFAGIFILLISRWFGMLKASVALLIVHGAAVWLLNESIITFSILTLELFLVALLRLKTHRFGFMFYDFIYWLVIGIPWIFVLNYKQLEASPFAIVLYTLTLVVNSLFNAMIAELIFNYLPLMWNNRHKASSSIANIHLSKLLIHITAISIIGSSLFFLVNTGRTAENNLYEEASIIGVEIADEIQASFASWTAEQMREPIRHFRELVDSASVLSDEAVLMDRQGGFIMGFSSDPALTVFPWTEKHEWIPLTQTLILWKAEPTRMDVPGNPWKSSAIILAVDLGSYQLYLKLSAVTYAQGIIKVFISQLIYIIYTAVIIGLFALFLHRFVVQSIIRLSQMTNDIPLKLKTGEPIHWTSSHIGEIQSLICNFRTVTGQLNQMLQETKEQANYDDLTNLPNRRLFLEYLNGVLQRGQHTSSFTAVMFIDLDHFKQINDTLGHEMGDALLQQAAARLQQRLAPRSFAARLGGDEFVIVTPDTSKAEVRHIAFAALEALTEPFVIRENTLKIGGSIGISLSPEDGTELSELLSNADRAMYRAKQTGGNTYLFCSEL